MKLIDISTPKFPNTFTMVDDEDYEYLNQWNWCLGRLNGYAVSTRRQDGKRRRITMHRMILNPPAGMVSDHINGNKLDNRRENLRVCTYAENNRNRNTKSGRSLPKGVCWIPKDRRFRADIMVNLRTISLGYYRTVAEAAKAYNAGAIKYHGEFARLNSAATEAS